MLSRDEEKEKKKKKKKVQQGKSREGGVGVDKIWLYKNGEMEEPSRRRREDRRLLSIFFFFFFFHLTKWWNQLDLSWVEQWEVNEKKKNLISVWLLFFFQQITIGIHCGEVQTGVIGQRMPRYCLFGNTVNLTSRTETTGTAGRINVSQDAYKYFLFFFF